MQSRHVHRVSSKSSYLQGQLARVLSMLLENVRGNAKPVALQDVLVEAVVVPDLQITSS